MTGRRLGSIAVALVALWAVAAPAWAGEVTVAQLDADPQGFDGADVVIQGEVVGDYGIRTDVVWVQINDDAYADRPIPAGGSLQGGNQGIGVRIPRSLYSPDWGPPGGFRFRGPILRITGVYHHNSVEEAGETFIEARSIEVVSVAEPIAPLSTDHTPAWLGLVSIVIGAALFGLARWKRANPE